MQTREDEGAIRLCAKRMCCLSKNKDLDRISWLPEHIIHDILDNLSSKDAARTCILSKTWKSFANSYPILHLDHNLFGLKCLIAAGNNRHDYEPNIREIREEFTSFVKYHLSKVLHHKLALRRLSLNVAIEDSKSFSRVDKLMDLVCKLSKVEELCIFVQTNDYSRTKGSIRYDVRYNVPSIGKFAFAEDAECYYIPLSVLALNGLRFLYVHGCKFGNHFRFRSNISSLQHLSLLRVALDEEAVINLTRYCPGIEILEFDECTFWNESLELSVFPTLKKVSILNCLGNLNIISIDKDGLESFKCNFNTRCEFIASACRRIRELIVSDCVIWPPNLFVELTTTFPLIEDMEVFFFCGLRFTERFKVVSNHLRKLSIPFPLEVQVNHMSFDCPNLEFLKVEVNGLKEVYLNCPNLRQFRYIGYAIPALPLFNTSAALKVIHYRITLKTTYFNSLWFMHLRGLIKQMAQVGRTIHLNLGFSPKMVEFIPLEYGAFLASMPSDVHLTIWFSSDTKFFLKKLAGFVDGLIWSTCPTTLTFACSCDGFLKDFCEKLAKKPRNESCGEFCNKCWWHYIVDFEVESFPVINPTIKDIKENLPTFVKMYQKCPKRPMCTFKLYWRCNEARKIVSKMCNN